MNAPKFQVGQQVFPAQVFYGKPEQGTVVNVRVKYEYLVEKPSGIRVFETEDRLVGDVSEMKLQKNVSLNVDSE